MIGDVARFYATCIASGGILRSVCELLIVPLAAWLAVRLLAPALRRMDGDPEWQAALAAAAVILPGALLLLMAVTAIVGGLHSVCTETVTGRVLFGSFIVLALILLLRAIRAARARVREIRALLALTVPPSAPVARAAADYGLALRELPERRVMCAIVGSAQPCVVISSGSIAALSDDELRAALLHERGHARRGDTIVGSVLAFFADVMPLPSRTLHALYLEAREFAADRHALREVRPEDLAGALLGLARARRPIPHAASIAENGVTSRLEHLLGIRRTAGASVPRRIVTAAALVAIAVAGLNPVRATVLAVTSCSAQERAAERQLPALAKT